MLKTEYQKIHRWIRKEFGRATYCSNNKNHKAKRYDWSNIDGKYHLNINDYKPLCRSCHLKNDFTEERREKYRKYKNSAKKIKQYDKNGKFIKEWLSSANITRELKILHTSISNVLAGRTRTAGGYKWQR